MQDEIIFPFPLPPQSNDSVLATILCQTVAPADSHVKNRWVLLSNIVLCAC